MKQWPKGWLRFFLCILLGLPLSCVFCSFGLGFFFKIPSSEKMESQFLANEAAYNELNAMFQQDSDIGVMRGDEVELADPKTGIGDFHSRPVSETRLSKDRIEQYKGLLGRLDVRVIFRHEDGEIFYAIGGHRFAGNGPAWGYVWRKSPPNARQLAANRDEAFQRMRSEGLYEYVPISGHWYTLYFN